MLPNVVTYAATLENLNKLLQNSWKITEICHDIWTNSYNVSALLDLGVLSIDETITIMRMEKDTKANIEFLKEGMYPEMNLRTSRFLISIVRTNRR